ncbi:MAG: hypothetical protein ACFB01_08825 [Cohaesibacteraceae bacterium]
MEIALPIRLPKLGVQQCHGPARHLLRNGIAPAGMLCMMMV